MKSGGAGRTKGNKRLGKAEGKRANCGDERVLRNQGAFEG